ncbi:MAG: AAA family ATPase, partial [Deltaproteobacteria bacterium]|nr:AAA family ATPase [Deltaproteobacteria bacterium]
MDLYAALDQVVDLLRQRGRLTYRALKYQFNLDDEGLEALKEELINAQQVATDEGGKVLVWASASPVASSQLSVVSSQPPTPNTQHPSSTQTADLGLRTSDFPRRWTPPHLAERILAAQAALAARVGTDGERKTITALFADIKGSMELLEDLDPEDARRLVDPALHLMMEAVHRYEGYVVQSTGDGIFAFFGAPLAHEDHPQRALYAALRMQEDSKRYAEQLRLERGLNLQIRVGVNTGEVVLRSIRKDDLRTDYTPIGHSTSLAARMESLATPGSVLVSEDTHRLTEGYFAFKSLGAARVKGVSEPVHIYEVVGVGPLRTRLQVAARRGLTRFVGRQPEVAQLRLALTQAQAGHGQIVGVMGEPGLGKSRLFYEFKLLTPGGCLVLEAFSVSYGKASPYLPLIELLKQYFDIGAEDDERKRRERITGKVLTLDRSLEDTLPYLFALLGIEEQPSPLQQMDPQIRRRRTFEALRRLFVRESLAQPLVLIFEDLHWIDNETQGFLDLLSEGVASAKILLLVNYRPEYRHEWGQKTYYTQLRLAPLGQAEAEELLTFLLGHDLSLLTLKQQILAKTEGTPFFMEEVVQTLVEEQVLRGQRGNYRLAQVATELHISPTVQGVLASRIDRLAAEEKALLQHLAVIGREFPVGLVRAVLPQSEEELYRLLSSLQRKEFLYEQPGFPEVEYLFKHALTQEVAYNSVLIEHRRALHEQVGQAIEARYSRQLDEHYSELAHHYGRSGNAEKAVRYFGLAGQQAAQRSANTDAIAHLTTALGLLTSLPVTSTRAQHELGLLTSLGPVLMAAKGFAAPEVGEIYARARALCQHGEDSEQALSVLAGLRVFYQVRGEHQTSKELAEQALALAQRSQDPTLLLAAYRGLTASAFPMGDFVAAREYAERGVALYDPRQHRMLGARYGGIDFGVTCLSYLSYTLWALGYPTQGEKRLREAFVLAHDLAHPFSQGFAQISAVQLYWFRRDVQTTREQAEALITLCTAQGFPQWLALGDIMLGYTLAVQQRSEEGVRRILDGIAAHRATGAGFQLPLYLGLLGETYGQIGAPEEGLHSVEEALTLVNKNDERLFEAELYRLKGELSLQSEVRSPRSEVDNPQSAFRFGLDLPLAMQLEAEACFLKAIDVARRQEAKS